tara:strand:+ start:18139 stop:19968 length:1830 start_codon:yes stop_codon:yes gene_type:complete
MKRIFAAILVALSLQITAQSKYEYIVDLNQTENDKLYITLLLDSVQDDEVHFYIPKMVPGTYQVYDFGQYVENLQAFNRKGEPLNVERVNDNEWVIKPAKDLYKITYEVEDTWDAENVDNFVFEPGGTNIEEGKNFVLNNHGFFGYINYKKTIPFEIKVIKPDGFYGATGLTNIIAKGDTDVYVVDTYMELVDSPIMYSKPDTAHLKVGNCDVLVSVYSPDGKNYAKSIAKDIYKTLEGQRKYLGGTLPVNKYAFIIYLYEGMSGSGGSGALEHSNSSLYYLPVLPEKQLSKIIIDVAAHEFFHIVTPLTIHSEEIGNFDYQNPKMSKHLWLYEGVTEYFAGHMQVYEGLISVEDYLQILKQKINSSKNFNDDISFTEMSKGVLDKYEDQYMNVYQKGALIGMSLDILLRKYSNGKMGLVDLMRKLGEKYGKDKSFKDDELIDDITEMTYPEIGEFLKTYVDGNKPLPLDDLFEMVGISYIKSRKVKAFTLGGIALGYNPETGRLMVMDTGDMNEFGKAMKYKVGDEIVSINGEELTMENYQSVFDKLKNVKEGEKITVVVARKKKGKEKLKKLSAKAMLVEKEEKNILEINPNATPEQVALRKAWLGQ